MPRLSVLEYALCCDLCVRRSSSSSPMLGGYTLRSRLVTGHVTGTDTTDRAAAASGTTSAARTYTSRVSRLDGRYSTSRRVTRQRYSTRFSLRRTCTAVPSESRGTHRTAYSVHSPILYTDLNTRACGDPPTLSTLSGPTNTHATLKTLKTPTTPGTKRTHTPVSYTHLRAHETKANLVCRLLLEKKN